MLVFLSFFSRFHSTTLTSSTLDCLSPSTPKMVSLWGSKKNDEEQEAGSTRGSNSRGGSRAPPSREEYEQREADADERTRLLPRQPRPPHADGYLDPDDPAVSYIYLHSRASTTRNTNPLRFRRTTSGPFDSSAFSPSSSSPLPLSGGFCSLLASSSLHLDCTLAALASSTFPTPPLRPVFSSSPVSYTHLTLPTKRIV